MIDIRSSLTTINNTLESITAFFYQSILQTEYTNNYLANYIIDYSLLLPSSQFVTNLTAAQVSAQIQEYINLCDALIVVIRSNLPTSINLFYERIQNTLDISIAQLNGFATTLLNLYYSQLFNYTIPYNMGLSTALYLNNLNMNTYIKQAALNYNLPDFNNLLQNTIITLSRA